MCSLEFYVECLNSRQGENEFQLFLFLITPTKSVVEGPQGVRRLVSKFHLRTSKEIQSVSLQERVIVEHRAVQSVHRLGEGNELLQTHRGVEYFSVARVS